MDFEFCNWFEDVFFEVCCEVGLLFFEVGMI